MDRTGLARNPFLSGRFVPFDGPVHRLDPRVKLVSGFLFAFVAFRLTTWWGLACLALYVAAAVVLARIPPGQLAKGLGPVILFVGLSALFFIFFTPGEPLARWGPLVITAEGASQGGLLVARLSLLLVGLHVVTLTTAPLAMTEALAWLLGPARRLGLPVAEAALMMSIALTFVPVLWDEFQRIVLAQRARGAVFGVGSPRRRMAALVPVIVPLFAGALRRAEELAVAMEARGYRGAEKRTRWKSQRWSAADGLALAASVGVLLWIGWRF